MGLKKLFKIKPPEEEPIGKNREELMELGIPTKNPNKRRRDKFAAYGKFARDKGREKVYAPPGYEDYARGEDDDLNKSEVDVSAQSGSGSGSGSSEPNPYEIPSGVADPYALRPSGGVSTSDPYADFGGAAAIGSRNFTSSYDGLGASRPGQAPSRAPAGAGPAPGAAAAAAAAAAPYASGGPMGASSYNDTPAIADMDGRSPGRSAPHFDGRASNPYGKRAAAPAAANPYSSMAKDLYSKDPLGIHGGGTDHLDEDLNEGPREGEFDFEGDGSNQVAVEEDLNATIDDPGDDLNAPITQQQQQQQQELIPAPAAAPQTQQPQQQPLEEYESAPQWQFEEEEAEQALTQGQQMGDSSRGYKTFEELQHEEEARQQQEEDEAVDEIKQEIRFTKQGSVASTRNTLRMAQEAEMSGLNTIGLLGHQSNQLGNVENNLDLIHSQNRIADDKIGELKRLNRTLFAVHVANPFNSKRRAREKEDQMKNRKIEDKLLQEEKLGGVQASSKRLEGAMNLRDEPLSVRDRYRREDALQRAKKYRFEADEEDDMMELEIDRNLDQIQQVSGRLKRLALAAGDELDAQQNRLVDVENNTDDMDIRLHLNTQRMAGIR